MPRPLSEAPRMLGRYHLFEAIDEDDLGALYLSRFEGPNGFQRWAVVRRMHPSLEADKARVDAFYEAARVAALVQHANVAVTFEVGQRQGPSWVAREYLHGESVRDLLARVVASGAHVPWDIACRIVADVAQGVETLHELRPRPPPEIGFLEGVITPGRAIVTYDGKSKVVEGSLPLASGRPSIDDQALAYRAPELGELGSADIRGEVFALGVLLWELCAGKRAAGFPLPMLRATIRCPKLIDDITQRAVARDPADRQSSCRVLARELEGCLVSKGLVVSDDEVGRYMLGVFADRYEEREASLLSAANVTEVFDRGEIAARLAELSAASQSRPEPPGDDDIDDTETPEMNPAFHAPRPRPAAPVTARSPERRIPSPPPTVETVTLRREEVPTPEVTAALFVLRSPRPPESVAMPLVDKPLLLLEKKKETVRGFDELPTVPQITPPPEGSSSDSVVFVGNDKDDKTVAQHTRPGAPPVPRSAPSSPAPPSSGSDVTAGLPRDLTVPTPLPPRRLADIPPVTGPRSAPRSGAEPTPPSTSRPVLPLWPPSLSSVLVAHERRREGLPPIVFVALGAAALLAIFAYLRFRGSGDAEQVTAFTESVSATASAAAAPAPRTDKSPSPWTPVPAPPIATGASRAAPSGASATPLAVDAGAPPPPKPPGPGRRAAPWRPPTAPAAPAPPPVSGKTGLLTVLCTPACDDVLDGARSLGPSPVFKASVGVGTHRLTLRTNDPPVKKVVSVVVSEDDPAVVRESMEAELDPRRY